MLYKEALHKIAEEITRKRVPNISPKNTSVVDKNIKTLGADSDMRKSVQQYSVSNKGDLPTYTPQQSMAGGTGSAPASGTVKATTYTFPGKGFIDAAAPVFNRNGSAEGNTALYLVNQARQRARYNLHQHWNRKEYPEIYSDPNAVEPFDPDAAYTIPTFYPGAKENSTPSSFGNFDDRSETFNGKINSPSISYTIQPNKTRAYAPGGDTLDDGKLLIYPGVLPADASIVTLMHEGLSKWYGHAGTPNDALGTPDQSRQVIPGIFAGDASSDIRAGVSYQDAIGAGDMMTGVGRKAYDRELRKYQNNLNTVMSNGQTSSANRDMINQARAAGLSDEELVQMFIDNPVLTQLPYGYASSQSEALGILNNNKNRLAGLGYVPTFQDMDFKYTGASKGKPVSFHEAMVQSGQWIDLYELAREQGKTLPEGTPRFINGDPNTILDTYRNTAIDPDVTKNPTWVDNMHPEVFRQQLNYYHYLKTKRKRTPQEERQLQHMLQYFPQLVELADNRRLNSNEIYS